MLFFCLFDLYVCLYVLTHHNWIQLLFYYFFFSLFWSLLDSDVSNKCIETKLFFLLNAYFNLSSLHKCVGSYIVHSLCVCVFYLLNTKTTLPNLKSNNNHIKIILNMNWWLQHGFYGFYYWILFQTRLFWWYKGNVKEK